jgi:uncharacterized radical SAM superfamily Fe-S cluster-containing enzyme
MSANDGTDRAVRDLREHMDRLRGRLFQFVEATGMNDKQERAVKGLIRTLTYDAQRDLESHLKRSEVES